MKHSSFLVCICKYIISTGLLHVLVQSEEDKKEKKTHSLTHQENKRVDFMYLQIHTKKDEKMFQMESCASTK